MKAGVVYPQIELGGDTGAVKAFAQAAEDLGSDDIVIYDHVLGAVHAGREPPPESRGHRKRIRKRVVGTVLLVFGILVWVMTATLPFTAYYARLVLRGHIELLSVGVVVGGSLVSAGIIQVGTSLVRRRR